MPTSDATGRPPIADVRELPVRPGHLHEVREAVAEFARRHRAAPRQLDALVLIASELVVNVVRHGGGQGTVRLWATADFLYCQVADQGPGIDPAIDPERPGDQRRGLWVVSVVADSFEIHAGPHGGTTVMARVAIGPATQRSNAPPMPR